MFMIRATKLKAPFLLFFLSKDTTDKRAPTPSFLPEAPLSKPRGRGAMAE